MTLSTLSAGHDPALPAAPLSDSPIQHLFRQWEVLVDQASTPGLSNVEAEALDELRHPIKDAIAAEPVTGLRDLAIKVLVNSGEGCFGLDDKVTLECATIAGRDFDKLPQCLFDEEE